MCGFFVFYMQHFGERERGGRPVLTYLYIPRCLDRKPYVYPYILPCHYWGYTYPVYLFPIYFVLVSSARFTNPMDTYLPT